MVYGAGLENQWEQSLTGSNPVPSELKKCALAGIKNLGNHEIPKLSLTGNPKLLLDLSLINPAKARCRGLVVNSGFVRCLPT